MIHPSDRQMDGRAIAYSALCYAICCHALKMAYDYFFVYQKKSNNIISLNYRI